MFNCAKNCAHLNAMIVLPDIVSEKLSCWFYG